MRLEDPFHEGELLVQERARELDGGQRNGRAIADSIVKGALKFFAQQPMIVLGSLDPQQNVWASILFGRPGFMTAPDDRTVAFDLSQAGINMYDPFWDNIAVNSRIGALLIELSTRRRLRINGSVSRPAANRLVLDVAESFPNCPKYIQRRTVRIETVGRSEVTLDPLDGISLANGQAAMIRAADMFFVASSHAERGVDASHRGGMPGFVEIVDDRTLRIPDYVGNSMYNTLGNFTVNPWAGLVFVDIERGRTLQLTGRAEVLWDHEDPAGKTGGTRRSWDFKIDRWRESSVPASVQWEFLDYSPHLPTAAQGAQRNVD